MAERTDSTVSVSILAPGENQSDSRFVRHFQIAV